MVRDLALHLVHEVGEDDLDDSDEAGEVLVVLQLRLDMIEIFLGLDELLHLQQDALEQVLETLLELLVGEGRHASFAH